MAQVIQENGDVQKVVVRSDKRMLYVIANKDMFLVVDPYMTRHETKHSTFDDAVQVASAFVD